MTARSPSVAHASAQSPKPPRSRNREKTREQLQLAILRVKNKGAKLTIAAVAAEVGVTAGLIHNTYPDVAEAIRAQIGKSTRQQRDKKASQLAAAKAKLRELRAKLEELEADNTRLASINETLRGDVATLMAAAGGKVVLMPRKPRKG